MSEPTFNGVIWVPESKPVWEGHICPEYEHCSMCVEEAWNCAAAVAFGLIGMADAIRTRNLCRHGKERCWECFHDG